VDEQTIDRMFELIYANMYALMPTGNTKEQDYALWRKSFDEGLRNGMRHILCHRDGDLRGYLSYVIAEADSTIHLCELQTCPRSRGGGTTFRTLLSEFARRISDCAADTIRTYANDRNPVSQGLIEKLGFEAVEKTHGGKRYVISKEILLKRLSRLMRSRPVSKTGDRLQFLP
jgi:GNAT superfamily N-acetyltransferase